MTEIVQSVLSRLLALPDPERNSLARQINQLLDKREKMSLRKRKGKRIAGLAEGRDEYYMADDFDDPLPDALLKTETTCCCGF